MHIDDYHVLMQSNGSNYVIGLKYDDQKPILFINFINPDSYDFNQALRDICTIAITSQTATHAQANIIAYAYQKMNHANSKITISIDEHIAVHADNSAVPVVALHNNVVEFYWYSVHSNPDNLIHLSNMNTQDVLSTTAHAINNKIHQKKVDAIESKTQLDDEEDYMHFHFFHRNQ